MGSSLRGKLLSSTQPEMKGQARARPHPGEQIRGWTSTMVGAAESGGLCPQCSYQVSDYRFTSGQAATVGGPGKGITV